jgi:hypothetical protein
MRPNKCVEITVRGSDMFGASFKESAQLLAVADSEVCLSMWRPVAENAEVEVQFYDDEKCWMRGQIMKVGNRLDGTQTVKVKMHSPGSLRMRDHL